MFSVFRVAVLLVLVANSAFAQRSDVGSANNLPALHVLLTPRAHGGTFDRLDVAMRIEQLKVNAGGVLLKMPLTQVGTPTARYDTAAIEATDAKGPLKLTSVDEPATPRETLRHWTIDRATVGDVTVRYGTAPRVISAATRNGPLYDLRAEAGGVIGAGIYFIALPNTTAQYRITVEWDLSHMPPGSKGVCSLGDGMQMTTGTADSVARFYYAAGPVKSEAAAGASNFALYWMSVPPFDAAQLNSKLHLLYDSMARFFRDPDASYRIFVRANPYPGLGGTALTRSFMFGYGPAGTSFEEIEPFLAHEMVHNWPKLEKGDYGTTAWYQEGTAEFYSAVLSLRAGVISEEQFLKFLNDRAADYYTSPFLHQTNLQAAESAWTDAGEEVVPYNRGFMYLASVDALIRERSGGKRSVDDLVVGLAQRSGRGEELGEEDWLALLTRELGESAHTAYAEMSAGKLIVPPANSFSPCLRPVPTTYRHFDRGFDEMRLAVVSDLRAESAAAKAGVKNGDVIVSMTKNEDLRAHPEVPMRLEVKRDGQPMVFTYDPNGPPVPGWKWERIPGTADSCGRLHL